MDVKAHDAAGQRCAPLRSRWSIVLLPALAGTGLLLGGCGTDTDAPPAEPPEAIHEAEADFELIPSPDVAPERPDARLGLTSPDDGERYQEGETVEVRFNLSGYTLDEATPGGEERGIARAPGQHIHLILNNDRYQALYDADEPVVFDDLPPGTHHFRAFPGTDWHESVKTPGAFAIRTIHVGDGEAAPRVDPDGPLLTYSRPVGEYAGADADSILVDFYLTGARLAEDGYRVRLTVNGMGEAMITEWRPYLLLGLPPGEHTVRLELLDPQGQVVPGEFNQAERTITVTEG
jgi:hypothetical protein